MFDISFEALRHPVITDIEVTRIQRVVYVNHAGELDLVADPRGPGRFAENAPSIQNFNGDRASQNVAVMARLLARGFVDPPVEKTTTGLFDQDTARATVWIRGEDTPLLVWIGARTSDRRLHLRTSDSEQIYLVSAHVASSLIPEQRHLERSDEQMRQLRAQAGAHTKIPEPGITAHDDPEHRHGTPLPTQVPPELMGELRDLAQEQRR